MLDGILAGTQGCFEVYLEEIIVRERPDPDPRLTGPHWAEEVRQRFDAELPEVVQAARLQTRHRTFTPANCRGCPGW